MGNMNNLSIIEMRRYIDKLLAQKRDYRQEVIDITERYHYVVFYGCGAILNSIVDSWYKKVGRKIDYCCDSDGRKWGKLFCGIQCLPPGELMAIKEKCAVFVTIGDFKPVYNFLKESGFPCVNQLYKYDLDAAEFLSRYEQEDVSAKLNKTYELLGDEQSQRVFKAIITRVLGDGSNIDIMMEVCEGNQYFPPDLIELSDHESFVDIGAFNGDTVQEFVGRAQGKFDWIFSFEVDAFNFKVLQRNVRKMSGQNRIRIFNFGIWDSDCDISYSIGESQSTVGSGDGKGHVAPLDNVLKDEKVTFIKMDIEGAEPQALRGARKIIQSQKPNMAVCVYHDFRHLWEIPLYLKALVPEYKIYLRHHTNLEYETVCYAIYDSGEREQDNG
jgi:FkbM family methyltransferase